MSAMPLRRSRFLAALAPVALADVPANPDGKTPGPGPVVTGFDASLTRLKQDSSVTTPAGSGSWNCVNDGQAQAPPALSR